MEFKPNGAYDFYGTSNVDFDFDDGERWIIGSDVQRRYLEALDRDAAAVAYVRENLWRGPAHRCRITCIVRGKCEPELFTWSVCYGRAYVDYDVMVERAFALVRDAEAARWRA